MRSNRLSVDKNQFAAIINCSTTRRADPNDAPKHPHMPHSSARAPPRLCNCATAATDAAGQRSRARANLASFCALSSRRVRTVSRTNWPQGENKMAGRQSRWRTEDSGEWIVEIGQRTADERQAKGDTPKFTNIVIMG